VTGKVLFDGEFLDALDALRIVARRVPAGGRHGEQRSRAPGGGAEFTDVRPYVPGDDLRTLDWHLLRRLDRLFVRLYLQEQDLPIHFLLDQSGSMARAEDGKSRARAAKHAVAALCYVALAQLDRVAIWPFAERALEPLPGASGTHGFQRVLAFLSGLADDGTTGLVEAVDRFARRGLRRGLCVVVSDFFDPRGIEPVVAALQRVRHRLLLVRPVLPHEARPELGGELELLDCEDADRTLKLTVDRAVLDRHEAAYAEFTQALLRFARRVGAGVWTVRAELPVVPQLGELFRAGALAV
jgi:uncharacterized protein (DUF58 family)